MTWSVNQNKCIKCGACVAVCPFQALELVNFPVVDNRCTSCKICEWTCPVKAIAVNK
jgi:electron transfer flavoprotein alpha subunit